MAIFIAQADLTGGPGFVIESPGHPVGLIGIAGGSGNSPLGVRGIADQNRLQERQFGCGETFGIFRKEFTGVVARPDTIEVDPPRQQRGDDVFDPPAELLIQIDPVIPVRHVFAAIRFSPVENHRGGRSTCRFEMGLQSGAGRGGALRWQRRNSRGKPMGSSISAMISGRIRRSLLSLPALSPWMASRLVPETRVSR